MNRKKLFGLLLDLKHKFNKNIITRKLIDDGIVKIKKKFNVNKINCKKYLLNTDFNFVTKSFDLEKSDVKKLINSLDENGVIKVIKEYLGNNLVVWGGAVFTLGKKKSNSKSMMPHQDMNDRCIKIYIWMDKLNLNTHPLFYLKKTHKKLNSKGTYSSGRYSYLSNNKFYKFYGDLGDIILFDTNGIHSHFKSTSIPRTVITVNFEPTGILNRINSNTYKQFKKRINCEYLENLKYN